MTTFDTLHAAKALTQAGFAPPQAEAITDTIRAAFTDSVATKADIAELRTDMAELRAELKADMAELRTELKADMAELRTELKAVEMRGAERFEALYKHLWLGAAGMVATIAALIRLLSG